MSIDYSAPCPHCREPLGGHTIAGYPECLKAAGMDYVLPFEPVPGAPIEFPGIEGTLVGEVSVSAAVLDSPLGKIPGIRFIFTGAGTAPMERRQMPPVTLVMDPQGLANFAELVDRAAAYAIDRSIS